MFLGELGILPIADFQLPIVRDSLACRLLLEKPVGRTQHVKHIGHQIGNWQSAIGNILAERVGFEPTERFPVHSISSAASSTTPAPLRIFQIEDFRLKISRRALLSPSRFQNSDLPIFNLQSSICEILLAERVGFEPTVGVNPLRFSRPVH
jgi:hypothetical protein